MYLIKELGLEKCKQIVGAPEGRDTYCLDAKDYFKQLPIMKRWVNNESKPKWRNTLQRKN